MDRLSSPLLALFSTLAAGEPDLVEQGPWRHLFDAKGVPGTFVLYQPPSDRWLVHDPARAREALLPHGTFDIANALIGLETGALNDELEVFHWDGTPKPVPLWERDHDLASGMAFSVAWMFQQVARRIGRTRMREWLERIEYGNRDVSGGMDHFWLQGGLRISALDQVRFLHRLSEGRLAATQRAQRLVRAALKVEKIADCTLYAKTGTTSQVIRDPVWWWVGWIERRGRVEACFALNFAPNGANRFADRFDIGRAILVEAGVLP